VTGVRRDEGGQAIALFAVSLPLFLVLLLLVIDGGRLLVEHQRLRNAAQFAAEAVVSMAGDASAQIPTPAQATGMTSASLARNLPEGFLGAAVNLTPPAQGAPFKATVQVGKTFVSSIQRITFTISATAAAQLGQSADGEAKRADVGPAAAGQPKAPSGLGEAVSPTAVPAAAGETCGKPSVVGGAITVPGEIAKLTGQGRYTAAGSTVASGARCQGDLYLGDGGATATYTLDVATAGDRYLWVRASDDGRHPPGARSVTVAINGQAALWTDEGKNVGWKWYPVGRFRLGEGRTEVRITKVAQSSAAFVMDEFVLTSDPGFVPR